MMRDERHAQHGVLLIFDEVLCVSHGPRRGPGVSRRRPRPVYARQGGRRRLSAQRLRRPADIMERLMPTGTASTAAPITAIRSSSPPRSPRFERTSNQVFMIMSSPSRTAYTPASIPFSTATESPAAQIGLGSRFGIYFGVPEQPHDFRDALQHSRTWMLRFIAAAIEHGVYFHDYGGGACHHGFCAAMTLADVELTLERLDAAVRALAGRVH